MATDAATPPGEKYEVYYISHPKPAAPKAGAPAPAASGAQGAVKQGGRFHGVAQPFTQTKREAPLRGSLLCKVPLRA